MLLVEKSYFGALIDTLVGNDSLSVFKCIDLMKIVMEWREDILQLPTCFISKSDICALKQHI